MVRIQRQIIPPIGELATLALCAGVLVLPLLGGGATPLGALVARLAALTAFLLFLSERRRTSGAEAVKTPLAALLLIALLGLLQSFAWPRSLVEVISPEHVRIAQDAALSLGNESSSRVALSLHPRASRRVALDCLILAILAISAVRAGRHRNRRLWLGGAVAAAAGLQIVLALKPWLGGQVPRLKGSYVNSDHLCILLEVAACVALAAVLWALTARRLQHSPAGRVVGTLIAGALLVVFLAAISFTGSRAGVLAIVVGLVVQAIATSRERRWFSVAAVAAVGAGTAGFLAWIGVGRSFGRLASTSWFDVLWGPRAMVWRESLGLIPRFPVTGSGLGTFESAYPLVQPMTLEGVRWAKAHNSYVELLVTGGVLGFAVAAGGTVLLLIALARRLRSAVRTEDRVALGAALGCIAAVGVHEVFDFGLSLSGNFFAFIVVVAGSLGVRGDLRG